MYKCRIYICPLKSTWNLTRLITKQRRGGGMREILKGALFLLWIAIDPSLVAGRDDRAPRKPPIGVRATPTMHTSVDIRWKRKGRRRNMYLSICASHQNHCKIDKINQNSQPVPIQRLLYCNFYTIYILTVYDLKQPDKLKAPAKLSQLS